MARREQAHYTGQQVRHEVQGKGPDPGAHPSTIGHEGGFPGWMVTGKGTEESGGCRLCLSLAAGSQCAPSGAVHKALATGEVFLPNPGT